MAKFRFSAYLEGTDSQIKAFEAAVSKAAKENGVQLSAPTAQKRIWPGDPSVPEKTPQPLANNEITDGPLG